VGRKKPTPLWSETATETRMRLPPPCFNGLGLTTVEVEFVIRAAKIQGITPADFIRLATLGRAQIVIESRAGNPIAAPPMPEVRGLASKKPAAAKKGESEPWDVRQMKRRLKGLPELKVIKGGKGA
jgi:hypothetical protein